MKMNKKHEAFTHKVPPHLYKIGMFAQMNHITVKALRFYEDQGLLLPAYVDGENGYRYYTMNQMADIQRITALKQAGFTLDDIKLINQGKNLEPNLLKIYLQDIKGENINEVNIVNLFVLLSMCGIEFTTVNMPK